MNGILDRAKRAVLRRLCNCDEIECDRCTGPWVPLEQRSKREIIEAYHELETEYETLRRRLRLVQFAAAGQIRVDPDRLAAAEPKVVRP